MNSKSLSHLKKGQYQKNIITRNILEKIKGEKSQKKIQQQNSSQKRVVWSRSQKILSQPSEKQPNKSKQLPQLGTFQQKSKFSTKVQSIEILKPIFDRMTSQRSSSSNIPPLKQNSLLQSKLKMQSSTFSRGDLGLQKKMKSYLASFLLKGDEKQLICVEQANDSFAKIDSFPWNVTVSLFTTLQYLLKNDLLQICQRYASAYIYSQYQTIKNEVQILSIFQDNSHISLICECFYFERVIALILALDNKEEEMQAHQFGWVNEMIKKVLLIRGLILEIVNEYEESFLKYNKLKKPSYLIREKKLISINKTIADQKEGFQKLLKYSHLKRFKFQLKTPLTHTELISKTNLLKFQLFHLPIPPFLSLKTQKYCLVCDPQGIFYTEDKKNTCIIIKPYAEVILNKIRQFCLIIIYSRRRTKSGETFMKEIGDQLFSGLLDRSFMTFREGSKIKDLQKLGLELDKTIVLDVNSDKYFSFWKQHCIPLSKNPEEPQLHNIVNQIQHIVKDELSIKDGIIASLFQKKESKHSNK